MASDASLLLTAAFASYPESAPPPGTVEVGAPLTNTKGLYVEVYRRNGSSDYIVSFRGTQTNQLDDIVTDFNLGWPQYEQDREAISRLINALLAEGGRVELTGHSLGGAIAQFAAYDLAETARKNGNIEALQRLSLTTWNALGGLWALQRHANYDPQAVAGLQAQHFFRQDDLVARLGRGHVGGETLRLDDPQGLVENVLDAHMEPELRQSLEAGLVTAATPAYLPLSDHTQSLLGNVMLGALMLWQQDASDEELIHIALQHVLQSSTVRPEMMIDLNLILSSLYVQHMISAVQQSTLDAVRLGQLMADGILFGFAQVQDLLVQFVGVLQQHWDRLESAGSQLIEQVIDASLTVGRAVVEQHLALSSAAAQLALWQFEQLLNALTPGLAILPLPGMPSLETFADAFELLLSQANDERLSPLVLDLDGDGVETLSLGAGDIRFDLNHDGSAEPCGWVAPDDGLLVRDRNGDGVISSGAELFGDRTPLASGQVAGHGFAALADLDGNHDGRIDAGDAAWLELGVWRDSDSNGLQSSAEWLPLAALGITALDLSHHSGSGIDAQGNDQRLAGRYLKAGDSPGRMVDVWFAVAPPPPAPALAAAASSGGAVASSGGATAPISRPAAAGGSPAPASTAFSAPLTRQPTIPDIGGLGAVASLQQTLAGDSSGRLLRMVQEWQLADAERRRSLQRDIVFAWAGVIDLPPAPVDLFEDQRVVAALHAFSAGRYLGGIWGWTAFSTDRLEGIFEELCQRVGAMLDAGSLLSPLWSEAIDQGSGDSEIRLDQAGLERALQDQLQRSSTDEQLIAAGQALESFPLVGPTLLTALRQRALQGEQLPDRRLLLMTTQRRPAAALGTQWRWQMPLAELIDGSDNADTIIGEGGDDVIDGRGGADSLQGGMGVDILSGGAGDDTLESHGDGDLIVFGRGDGQDTIRVFHETACPPDPSQSNVLHLRAGITAEDVIATLVPDGLSLTFRNSQDSLVFREYLAWDFAVPDAAGILQIQFSDGRRWGHRQIMERAQIGSPGNDRQIGSAYGETIDGGAGDDAIEARGGNDMLLGGSGHDCLIGGSGDNTYSGGSGNDTLVIDEGPGRILFRPGDGQDLIIGSRPAWEAQLIFEAGIQPADIRLTRLGNDLVLTIGSSGDRLQLRDYFHNNAFTAAAAPIRSVAFNDGTLWDSAALTARYLQGDASNNHIEGLRSNDTLRGEGGQDTLQGWEGDDLLLGGSGNDLLHADSGADRLDGGDGDDELVISNLEGEDSMVGGSGRNTFNHQRGDLVLEANPAGSVAGTNTLQLAALSSSQVSLRRQDNLLLINGGSVGTIRVIDFFRDGDVLNRFNPLQTIRFTSGSWDARTLASKVSNSFLGTSADNKLSGSSGDDWIDGLAGNDQLQGQAGHDVMRAGAGNDTLIGGAGDDLLQGDEGSDTASWAGQTTAVSVDLSLTTAQDSGAGRDSLSGIEHLLGGSGADRLLGNEAANRLEGDGGDDLLEGGAGNDTLVGGNQLSGGDTLSYSRASGGVLVNLALTASQNTGGAGSDLISGCENLVGSAHADSLSGSSGANRLEGGSGDDSLLGGTGADTLMGGIGADRFLVSSPAEAGNGSGSRDWILDLGGGDRLDLTGIDARSDLGGNQAFSWIGEAAFTALGQLRHVRLSNGNGLLEGNCSGNLAADFQLELSGNPELAAAGLVLL